MNARTLIALLAVGGLSVAACSDDPDTNGSGGADGTGGAAATTATTAVTATTTTSVTATTTTTGAGGGMGICGGTLTIDGDVADGCLTANCCESFEPCEADEACFACLQDPMGAGCDSNTLFTAYQTCQDTSCPFSVCGTELGFASLTFNACVENSCCTEFTACQDDNACQACIQNSMGAGCDADTLYQDWRTCADTSCPGDVCGTGIGYTFTYENGSQDVAIDTNACASTNCCTELTDCADPSADGNTGQGDAEVQACLDCLNGDPGCPGGAVETAAMDYVACFDAACSGS